MSCLQSQERGGNHDKKMSEWDIGKNHTKICTVDRYVLHAAHKIALSCPKYICE